jgi:hypothetical protein
MRALILLTILAVAVPVSGQSVEKSDSLKDLAAKTSGPERYCIIDQPQSSTLIGYCLYQDVESCGKGLRFARAHLPNAVCKENTYYKPEGK